MTVTIEARVEDRRVYPALKRMAEYFGFLKRKLFSDLYVHKKQRNDLKSSYITNLGISGRHFNSLACEVDALVSSRVALQDLYKREKTEAIRATEKTCKLLTSRIKSTRSCLKSIQTYRNRVLKWRKLCQTGKKTTKPRQPKKIQGQDAGFLREKLRKDLFTLHQKKRRLGNLREKLKKLEEQDYPAICFGTKKLFRAQFNLKENNYSARHMN